MNKIWIIGLLAGVGCGDAETGSHIGNPVSLAFTIFSSLSSESGEPVILDENSTEYTLTNAKMNVGEIRLNLPTGTTCADLTTTSFVGAVCGLDDDVPAKEVVRVMGPFVVDLIDPKASPLDSVRVPSLAYSKVLYRLENADPADGLVGATDPLANLSFIADAAFDKEAVSNTLHLALKINDNVEIENAAGIEVGRNGSISIKLDASNWLAGAGIGACLEDGSIPIQNQSATVDEDTECGDAEEILNSNILSSARVSETDADEATTEEPM
jgi:hypothetical protein